MTTNNLLNSLKALAKVLETNGNPSSAELKLSAGVDEVGGICDWVGNYPGVDGADYTTLHGLLESWPEGTGSSLYVVPPEFCTGGDFSPGEAFEHHLQHPFNPDQPYCQARRRLLYWLIEQLEGES